MNKFYWGGKTAGLVFRIILSVGLMALLFGAFRNTRAIVSFSNGEYTLETQRYIGYMGESGIAEVMYVDFNNDGNPEKIVLEEGIVTVTNITGEILKTDSKWTVEEILVGDFNNDGSKDLGIYLWKIGNYGPSMPFWVEENDDSFKQHLFLYTWRDDKLKALWHSSNLPYQNIKTILADISGDGQNELLVLEKPYDLKQNYGVTVAVWQWDEWGFINIWRSEKSQFHDIEVR